MPRCDWCLPNLRCYISAARYQGFCPGFSRIFYGPCTPVLTSWVRLMFAGVWSMVIISAHYPRLHIGPRTRFWYRKTSNISRTLVGNKIVDNSCSWSIACRHCSNYIFILNLTPGFNGLSEDNCKRIQETFKLLELVRLILGVLR